ncbi:hypothetical protein KC19_VG166800 [Ceratodon purpureus]|uniref:Uncharacterized protein n=1 Tax=Ceratodon purpureus TaxID=3225 RepID=A0A8T0HQT2_CERPU|nr:hypothetical protein KC19_VG166800 [Ceratodon purpureus]
MTISGEIVTRSDLGQMVTSQHPGLENTNCPFLLSMDMSKIVARSYLDQLVTTQRLEVEVANYWFLLAEDMRESEERVKFSRLWLGSVPYYVSSEGCARDAGENLEYYDL